MKLIIQIIMLLFLISCSKKIDNKTIETQTKDEQPVSIITTHIDTLQTDYPMKIANDKGVIAITAVKTYKDKKLSASNFTISLKDIPNHSFSEEIDANLIIEVNKDEFLQDSLTSKYINSVILKEVIYQSVRSNSLYFKGVLEDPIAEKEIIGRFAVFYPERAEGRLYGWITDEVR